MSAGTSANEQFCSLVDRILRCREAEDEAKADTKDVYAEAKGAGYDKAAIGRLVAKIRARDKDSGKAAESAAIDDIYHNAYFGRSGTEAATHTYTRASTEPTPAAPVVEKPVPPAIETATPFTIPRVVLRPHCLNRENCGSGIPREHCGRCKRAMEQAESEAA